MSHTPPVVGSVPGDCERIIIVGAGGFGREVLQWARHAWPEHRRKIAGFLSDDPRKLDGFPIELPIIGSVRDYRPAAGEYLILAVGTAGDRRRVAEDLTGRGGVFLTVVHPSALVAASASIGAGAILCPHTIASESVTIGMGVLINYYCSLGHDAVASDFAILSPYASLGGGARIGEDTFLGLHASIGPRRTVGARCKVSANSAVLNDAPDDSIIFGSPGRIVPRVQLARDRAVS